MFTKNPNSSIVHFILALIILTGMLGAKPASLVHASSLTVTNINDGGAGSLRQTIADAVSGDTITFDPSLDGQTIIINATLSIDKNLTIDGSSLASKIIISGESNVRVFEIYPNNTVVMEYLAISNGKSKSGSGILNKGSLTVINGYFYNNFVTGTPGDIIGDGGAINNYEGYLNVIDSMFYNNNAQVEPNVVGSGYGGAIHNDRGTIHITGSSFTGNSASSGGAVSCSAGWMSVANSTFFSNGTTSNTAYGGAIFDNNCISTITSSTFYVNFASKGGAINTDENQGALVITNSTFVNNEGASVGGAIASYGGIVIKNSTFSGNNSPDGGAIRIGLGSALSLYNSILANSVGGPDCTKSSSGIISVNIRNLIETTSSEPDLSCGTPYLTSEPKLGELWSNGPFPIVMGLLKGSPAINAGDNGTCTAMDQRGINRPQDSRCDLGATEIRTPLYVKWDAVGINNGSSWKNAYTDLQIALTTAITGEEIWVAAGTYKPTTGTDRTLSFMLNDGMELYGGFLGTETARSQHTTSGKLTILSGDIGVVGDNSDNSGHVVSSYGDYNTVILDGFTITGGNAKSSFLTTGGGIDNGGSLQVNNSIISSNTAELGGGIGNMGTLNITNSVISGNSADFGGGIWIQDSTVIIKDSVVSNNSAQFSGGGVESSGRLSIKNSVFSNNIANEGGGGVESNIGTLDITDSLFSNNSVNYYGGGVLSFGPLTIMGSTFLYNSAVYGGGGIYSGPETANITNSTFFKNSAIQSGGAVISLNGILNITNSTFSDNISDFGGSIYNGGSTLNLINTILANSVSNEDCYNINGTIGTSTNNLIETNASSPYQCGDPALTGDPKLDISSYKTGITTTIELLPDSPAIDAGNDVSCPVTDQRGIKRPQGAHCDIGAFEYEEIVPMHPVLKSQVLTPSLLTTQSGTTNGASSNLNLLDQTGTNDDPATYVSFQNPNGPYLGYQSFFLPQGTQAKLVSTMLLQLNVKTPASSTQVWTWSIYDWNTKMWIEIGDTIGLQADQWQDITIRIRQPWKYVSPGNEIRIQLTSRNTDGNLKVDYAALHVTYLSLPVRPTLVPADVNSDRPGIFSVP